MSTLRHTLLLLPDPPQRLTHSDIYAALYPPLAATVSFLKNQQDSSVLDIALPIHRIASALQEHHSFLSHISTLLERVYSLLAKVYRENELSPLDSAFIDSRIILVLDDEVYFAEHQILLCGTIHFGALARSSRSWTHIFIVESESGRSRYNSFNLIVKEERPEWNPQSVTVPGGLQFLFPDYISGAEDGLKMIPGGLLSHDILVAIKSNQFDFTNKYTLTMGLLAMKQSLPLEGSMDKYAAERRRLFVATVGEDTESKTDVTVTQQKPVVDFLHALLEFGSQTFSTTYSSKVDTLDTSYLLSAIEQRFCVQCFVSTYKHTGMPEKNGVGTILTTVSLAGIAAKINEVRRGRGWTELGIMKLSDITT